jgi:putative ABC transport system permease protein
MHTLLQDTRYGARMLLKRPGFTIVAVITLALGIGANTAIFSVVNAVLLRPLPFAESSQLVMVWNKGAEAAGGDRTPLSVADVLDWREQTHAFENVAAFQHRFFNYTGGDVPERIRGAAVTANFFSTLGVNAALGRTFETNEELPGASRVVVIGDAFWRRSFAADPNAIGRTIKLNDVFYTIVGVMPSGLNLPAREAEIWTAMQVEQPSRAGPWFLVGVGRMKHGITVAQAVADTQLMQPRYSRDSFNLNLVPINDYIVGDLKPALLALLTAVTIVLLIAAANVANLLLARSSGRIKEISIRTALGASRWRIVRQLLTESLLLAFVGGALGVFTAWWGVELLRKIAPENIPRLDEITVDARVLGWTFVVTLLTGLIFGLAPALQGSRLNLNETLKEGGRGATEGAGRRRWRSALVVSELALAVTLLVGAGLLLKSLWRLEQVDVGVNPERVLTMQLALRGQRYNAPPPVLDFCSRLIDRIQAIPGVNAAALSDSLPPNETSGSSNIAKEGQTARDNPNAIAYFIRVSDDYFRAMGTRLLAGRYFNSGDIEGSPYVTLINERLQKDFFSNEDPIGKRLNIGSDTGPEWRRIVGVVGDVKYNGIAEQVQPALYLPIAQAPALGLALIIKTDVADPTSLTSSVREEISKLDSELPISQIATLQKRLDAAVSQPRFRTTLIALFAAVALSLACIGIYGVMSYSVVQRTHEIGIRMALGAKPVNVLKMVINQGLMLTAAGLVSGLGASYGLTRLMSSLLFRVEASDPATFMLTALLLAFTALVACYIPARRATKVDPMVALRHE